MEAVTKYYNTRKGPARILDNVDLTINRAERIGILGRNGAGKSTLIRLISGAEQPTRGTITRSMSVSWPLAFSGAFSNALTGLDNLRFICRMYNVDPATRVEAVQEFSELGLYLREPIRNYSAGMRSRLAFAISMTIDFDCFLIDEVISVGDARFREKCHYELFEKRSHCSMIIVSHDPGYIREHCHRAAVLHGGTLHHFDTMDEAYDFYLTHLTG